MFLSFSLGFLLAGALQAAPAAASKGGSPGNLSFQAGVGIYQQSGKDTSRPAFFFGGASIGITPEQSLIPEVGYIMSEDKANTKRSHYFVNLDWGYRFALLRGRAGVGLLSRQISGNGTGGGSVDARGYGDNAPRSSMSGRVFTTNLGLELEHEGFLVRAEYYIIQIFDSKVRQLNLAISGGLSF